MMENKTERSKKALLNMELSTFPIPPSAEVLVLAKRCPIGAQAAKRMLETVAPGQFELILLQDDLIEGILIKKYLFLRADKDSLIKAITEESKAIMSDQCMITIKIEITLRVQREI